MPALSPTMTEGKITAWRKKEGDTVTAGDVLLEIETDKAGMDVEAADDGILAKILANGSKVAVNEVIALLAEEGDDLSKVEIPKSKAAPKADSAPAKEEKKESAPTKKEESKPSQKTASTPSSKLLSPAVAHLLLQNHIDDVTKIPSTGPKGRVLKGDVLAFLGKIEPRAAPEPTIPQPKTLPPASKPAPAASKSPSASAAAPGLAFTDSPTSNMRKVIASRLSESKSTIPHSYVTRDIVIDNMMKLRHLLADELHVKVSVNDFLIKASSLALRDVPESNVQFVSGGDSSKQIKDIDISVAVATPTGLITPIVKGADTRGLQSISSVVKELAERAKKNKLKPEEYQGGSFSISNLGMFGVNDFTAIINPPHAANLAVGGARTIPKPSPVEETDLLSDSEVFDYLGGQSKKKSVYSSSATKKADADLELLDYLGGKTPLKKKSTSTSETVIGDEILRSLRPSPEKSQVISVTLSIDERVIDADVAGRFLKRLSHYIENPESIIL
ncbi:hypothetical protein BGZ49_002862 [Haplosporangium sp. Z 27]|nr:hypothetical protein BGZ49_002862 [Haplosporangium sp. Z 27]